MAESKRPQAVYEPGELEKTRENLGILNPEEAKQLAKKLGGVVGVEKTAPLDPVRIRKTRKHQQSQAEKPDGKSAPKQKPKLHSASSAPGAQMYSVPSEKSRAKLLPAISQQERNKMDRLMMSSEFQIKKNYGIFNFIYFLFKNRSDNVLNSFAARTIPRHIAHLHTFNETIFTILKLSPESFKQTIMTTGELKFKLLKKFASWAKMLDEVKNQYKNIDPEASAVTIEMLVPLIRAFYKMILQVHYLGENRVSMLLKAVFDDLIAYPDAKKKELLLCMRTAAAEWQYIYNKISIGMYPLLMRMCCTECVEGDDFFFVEVSRILPFLGITKFDILVAEKKGVDVQSEVKSESEKKEEEEKKAEKDEQAQQAEANRRERFKLTETGLKLLEFMFPGAGWLSISLDTDMFPYYQPIYQFPDGVNLLAPQNPIQIIIVLIRILEDFFRGCRNITFDIPPELAQTRNDVFSTAVTEWMSYREVLFEKNYSPDLKDYVNNLYSKADFNHTPIGKKLMFNLLWQTKHYFLPFFKVDSLSLEKPSHEVTLKQLSTRVMFLRDVFAVLAKKIDAAVQTRAEIPEIPNAWEKYKFDIDNAVSLRLDALLGAKKNSPMAVNASIVKYTAAVLAVLDWWINDETSPARDQENFRLFRTSPIDGRPVFSTDLRMNTEDLFRKNLKKFAGQAAPQNPANAFKTPQTEGATAEAAVNAPEQISTETEWEKTNEGAQTQQAESDEAPVDAEFSQTPSSAVDETFEVDDSDLI